MAQPGAAPPPALRHGSTRARYRRILRFAAARLVQVWWFELVLPRLGLSRLAERNRAARLTRTAEKFRALAVTLGGLMIKVGQFLSSRLDVLPPEITEELSGLQDEVPAVPFPEIRALAEAELGMPLGTAYAAFDDTAVAAASLGQAHRARLEPDLAADTGFADVIVKVQRPGIDAIVDVDLAALRRVAGWLTRFRFVAEHVDAAALVEEFAHTSRAEIDYIHEAVSAERFAALFARDPRVRVPDVAWERTTRRVLTLSDVTAIKMNDVAGLRAAGIDPSEVATSFAEVMFDQLFGAGFFHADPHPGNLFVTPATQEERDAGGPPWQLTFVDFGMMGEISDTLRRGLRRVLIAIAARDGRGLVDGIRDVGMLLPSADVAELEKALTTLFGRFGGMGFAQLREVDPREFREFADEFGEVVRSLPFQLPENFLLVIRAVSLMSGMCSSLDPQFNIWSTAEPYAARLLREEGGHVVRDLATQAASYGRMLFGLPGKADIAVTRFNDGTAEVATPEIERRLTRLERLARRVISAVIFAALLIGGILLRASEVAPGIVLMSLSAIPLFYAVFAGFLTRRRR